MQTMKQKKEAIASKQARLDSILDGTYASRDGTVDQEFKKMVNWFVNVYYPMPEWEKQVVRTEWDKYYLECSLSPEAQRAFEAREALRKNDVGGLRLVLEKPHTVVPIEKPQGFDYAIWDNAQWAYEYRLLRFELNGGDGFKQALEAGTW